MKNSLRLCGELLHNIFNKGALYPVITPSLCINDPIAILKKIAGIVDIVQLRMKDGSDRDKLLMAKKFRENFKGILIIDDRADIALLSGADGVHIGQEDITISDVRKINSKLLIGVSTHNKSEIRQAIDGGADYINIGPIFPTQTKFVLHSPIGIEQFKEISQNIDIPFSVMGGIKTDNIDKLFESGARIFAVVTAITKADDPLQIAKIFQDKINSLAIHPYKT